MTLRPSNEAAAKMALADERHQLSAASNMLFSLRGMSEIRGLCMRGE